MRMGREAVRRLGVWQVAPGVHTGRMQTTCAEKGTDSAVRRSQDGLGVLGQYRP